MRNEIKKKRSSLPLNLQYIIIKRKFSKRKQVKTREIRFIKCNLYQTDNYAVTLFYKPIMRIL